MNISSACPCVNKRIYCNRQFEFPYFDKQNKRPFVYCTIVTGYDSIEDVYFVVCSFNSMKIAYVKTYADNDYNRIINLYRYFRRYSNKLPYNRDIGHILHKDGFECQCLDPIYHGVETDFTIAINIYNWNNI
jgi:hypothetical protein